MPTGVSVEGATMAISSNNTNIWFLDVEDSAIDSDGTSYTITFNVENSIIPDTDSEVTITVYSQDNNAQLDDILSSSTTIDFIDGMITSEGSPVSTITASITTSSTTITEDTKIALSELVSIDADETNDPDGNATYSLAINDLENVSFDMDSSTYTINTYEDNGETIYVISVTGTQEDIDAMLESVYLIADENYNVNNASSDLSFTAVLTAYDSSAYSRDTASVTYTNDSVAPITDEISTSVTKTYEDEDGITTTSAQEDGKTYISIDLDTVDDPNYTIVQGASDSTEATTVSISLTSGVYGTLYWNGGSYTFSDMNTSAEIPIDALNDGNLYFEATQDASGTATFTYTIYALETGASNIFSTTNNFTITVNAVADGLYLPDLEASGEEDSYIQIYADGNNTTSLENAQMIDIDDSESISSMYVTDVPDGFLVYIEVDGEKVLATKGDTTGTTTINDEELDVYSWTIDISDGIPNVYILAPDDWSSVDSISLTLTTVVKDGSSTTSVSSEFDLNVSSVVDGFSSISANDSIQTASMDVTINLNANAIDLDGSETGVLTLSGLGTGASFAQDSEDLSSNVTYDLATDTYTITNIDLSTDKLNTLTFQQAGLQDVEVSYTFYTVETDSGNTSEVESGTFNVTTDNIITDTSTNGTVGEDDRLILSSGDIDLSSISSDSIEKIDLTQNGDTTLDITINDVIDITDSSNDLIILADDNNDIINLSGNWETTGESVSYGDDNLITYTNSDDSSVKVQISEDATVAVA